jgi:hypothetical protein
MSAVPPLSMPGTSSVPSSAGTPGDDRPVLPRRTRQANLVPQLRDEDTRQPELRADQDLPPAEATRDRLAAFQRGTRQGRDGDN